ncbi:HlyD family secretion protein [Clostridium thailandense]|uniref:HlyD family secretion protein n=1 Tax=Clostridium thailandense TaxID=2794346 RepID=UPI00398A3E95
MKKYVSLLVTLAILFIGCSSGKSNISESVKVNSASQDKYLLSGKIQADNSANVSSKINAKVIQLKVDIGSKVNAGDTIIYLDTKDLEAQLKQAEASVGTAEANLDKIKAGSRSEQIASSQALVEGAKTAYEVAQKNYDRQKQLLQGGNTAQVNLEQAEQALASTKAQYDSAAESLAMLQNGSTQTDINAVAATVKQAEAAVEIAKTSISYANITAPISGTVTAKNINEGEMSGIGQPLVTIVGGNELHIDSYAPEDILPKLEVGQKVKIKIVEFPEKAFEGEISTINAQIDSRNKSALVKIALKDDSNILKPGMFTEIALKNKEGE